jgi:hypothetical protein
VRFDGRPVKYDYGELDEVSLAYAVTIHKSQRSECPGLRGREASFRCGSFPAADLCGSAMGG